jgi:hypothetical protein
MGTHNSPAYRDGIADHERRNDLLSQCPAIDLDLCQPGKWGGPYMYLRGWREVPDVPPHSCDRCNGRRDAGNAPDGQSGGYDAADGGYDAADGAVDMWA